MRKSFKDSLKALEADIQYANTLNCCDIADPLFWSILLLFLIYIIVFLMIRASDFPSEYDDGCLQMRLSYSPAAHFFLFLVQWTDCHLAGVFGLLRILICKAYTDGKTTMTGPERKATIRDFYGVIFPSLMQLQRGITELDDRKQKEICATKYKKRDENKGKLSEIDLEREEECGICMETRGKIVLPNCNHLMCMKCFRNWRSRSQSCPFCRDSLKRVDSGELWIYTSDNDTVDLSSILTENMKRLLMYIEKLPLVVLDPKTVSHDPQHQHR
ncbi:hypothetical protein PTKIN_Ptkin13bG0296900 [Pterospermum kingtungense]